MSNVLVNDTSLTAIANAIRSKLGVSTTYKPGQMASAIQSIPTGGSAVLGTKTITANGTYNASSDNYDGYSQVVANVPNTYTSADEHKVVSNGALIAQFADTVTTNGTWDTTLINSLTVNVSGGGLDYTIRQVNVTNNNPTVTRDFTNFIFIAQVDEDSLPTTPANTTAYYLEFAYVNGNFIRKANNKAFVVVGGDSTYKGSGSNAANLSVGTTSITFTAYTSQFMYNSTWNVIQIELPNDADIYSFATH